MQERERGRQYHYANRKEALARMREWQRNNGDKVNERNRNYRAARREKFNAINKAWRAKNHAHILYRNALRKKHIKLATPAWANHDRIRKVYIKAVEKTKATGVQYHVDHILPLRGKNVCGLHVENNLRVILAKENLAKGNR